MIIASCFDTYGNMTKNKQFKETTNSVESYEVEPFFFCGL